MFLHPTINIGKLTLAYHSYVPSLSTVNALDKLSLNVSQALELRESSNHTNQTFKVSKFTSLYPTLYRIGTMGTISLYAPIRTILQTLKGENNPRESMYLGMMKDTKCRNCTYSCIWNWNKKTSQGTSNYTSR